MIHSPAVRYYERLPHDTRSTGSNLLSKQPTSEKTPQPGIAVPFPLISLDNKSSHAGMQFSIFTKYSAVMSRLNLIIKKNLYPNLDTRVL